MKLPEIAKFGDFTSTDKYVDQFGGFSFIVKNALHISEFFNNPPTKMADVVLNTEEGCSYNKSLYGFIDGPEYKSALTRFRPVEEHKDSFTKDEGWVYFICYNGYIMKIGHTTKTLTARTGSYGSGGRSRQAAASSTNFFISELNYTAVTGGLDVELYAVRIAPDRKKVVVDGEDYCMDMIHSSKIHESAYIRKYRDMKGVLPPLCTQG